MGNQTGKVSVKGTKFIDDIDSKTSKTNWIAGMYSLVMKFNRNLAVIFIKQEKKILDLIVC